MLRSWRPYVISRTETTLQAKIERTINILACKITRVTDFIRFRIVYLFVLKDSITVFILYLKLYGSHTCANTHKHKDYETHQ